MKTLVPLIIRFVIYALAMLGVALIIRHDFKDALILEDSAIEIAQEASLAISILLLGYYGKTSKAFKIFNLSLAGVLAVHFVREFDFWLNYNLFDNSWQVFAAVFVLLTLFLMFKNFKRFVAELAELSKTYSFAIFLIGFIMLHLFSRLFGSKKIWNWLLEPMHNSYISTVNGEKSISLIDFVYPVKTGAQEGIELLAYTIMFIGVVEICLYTVKISKRHQN